MDAGQQKDVEAEGSTALVSWSTMLSDGMASPCDITEVTGSCDIAFVCECCFSMRLVRVALVSIMYSVGGSAHTDW